MRLEHDEFKKSSFKGKKQLKGYPVLKIKYFMRIRSAENYL